MFKIFLSFFLMMPLIVYSSDTLILEPITAPPITAPPITAPPITAPPITAPPVMREVIILNTDTTNQYMEVIKRNQEKKELIQNKQKNIRHKIDIPIKPLPPGGLQDQLLNKRNEMIFLKEQASISEREYNRLVIEKRRQKIFEIKQDMLKYNISNNELY